MSTIVPIAVVAIFIAMVIIISEYLDNERRTRRNNIPTNILDRREKMRPYMVSIDKLYRPGVGYINNSEQPISETESTDD